MLAEITEEIDRITHLILDFRRVLTINDCSSRLIHLLIEKLKLRNHPTLLVHSEHLPQLRKLLQSEWGDAFEENFLHFNDLDHALEWCEDRILKAVLPYAHDLDEVTPVTYDLLKGLTPEEVDLIQGVMQTQCFVKEERIIREGEVAAEVYFLRKGKVSVFVDVPNGQNRRVATFSSGMVFGEMAAIDRAPRSAMIIADSEVECDILYLRDLDQLGEQHPAIKIKLLENLCHGLYQKLRKANRELGLLE